MTTFPAVREDVAVIVSDDVGADQVLATIREAGAPLLSDAEVFDVYRDPERVHEWAAELSTDTPVVVYCSYGFNVGCAVTGVLRERGFDARFLDSGLSGWYAAGGARGLLPEPELQRR